MPIQVVCVNPQCGQLLNCPDSLAGKQTKCPKCGTAMQIPAIQQTGAQAPAASQTGQSGQTSTRQLGKYQLLDKLGAGGMGVVYKAVDASVNRTVALKILSTSLAEDEKYVGRFMREARAAAALNHPNIVGAVDFGTEGKYYYFAMEFVDGENCRKLIKSYGVYPETQAIDISIGVANALQHAWARKIVHRDIKPDNIMLSLAGEVKLADMGLAKATDSSEATLTQAGHMIGTPQFASPEQIRGQLDIDCRTDIYSLGMTLYYLVIGQPAFDGPTAAVITSLHLEQPFPDPKASRPDLSDGFCTMLRKMTEKAPENRYQSPEELLQDLQLVRNGQAPVNATAATAVALGTPQAAVPVAEPHGVGKFLILPLVAILAVGGGAGYLFYKEKQRNTANQPPGEKSPEDTDPSTRRANRLLRAALRHAEQNPTDFPEILRRLDAVKSLAQGTALESETVEKIMVWHQKWAAAAQREFAERKKKAEACAQASEFDQALAVWAEFPGTLCTEAAKGLIEKEKARLMEQKAAIVSAPPDNVEPPDRTAGATGPAHEGDPTPAETVASGLPIDAYLNVMQQLAPAFEARDPAQISQTAQRLLQEGENPSLTSFLEQLRTDAPKVGTFVASTVEALKGQIGQEVRISGIPMKVLAVDEEKLTVEVAGAEQEKPFLKMRGKDLLALQGLTDEAAPAEKLYAAGLVHFIDGQHKDAVEYLSKGGEESQAKLYKDLALLAVEAEAMGRIKELRAALEKNDLSGVQRLLKEARESYGQTKVVALHEGFLNQADQRVRAAQNQRKGQLEHLLGLVDEVAKAELTAMEKEYEAKRQELEKAQQEELTLPQTISVEEVRGIRRGDSEPVKLKPGDDLPMGGQGWQLVSWCEYKIEPKPILKEEQFKHLDKFVDNTTMDDETRKVVRTAYTKLKKEVPAVKKKYSSLSSKLRGLYSGKKRSLDARAKRLALKIKDGETPSEAEIRAYLAER